MLSAVVILSAVASIAFVSCSKEQDVNLEQTQMPVSMDAKVSELPLPCTYCNAMVNPGEVCEHIIAPEECHYGQYCNHFHKWHKHIFWNQYHDGNLHYSFTTHCGAILNHMH